jgi:hypothetical protein
MLSEVAYCGVLVSACARAAAGARAWGDAACRCHSGQPVAERAAGCAVAPPFPKPKHAPDRADPPPSHPHPRPTATGRPRRPGLRLCHRLLVRHPRLRTPRGPPRRGRGLGRRVARAARRAARRVGRAALLSGGAAALQQLCGAARARRLFQAAPPVHHPIVHTSVASAAPPSRGAAFPQAGGRPPSGDRAARRAMRQGTSRTPAGGAGRPPSPFCPCFARRPQRGPAHPRAPAPKQSGPPTRPAANPPTHRQSNPKPRMRPRTHIYPRFSPPGRQRRCRGAAGSRPAPPLPPLCAAPPFPPTPTAIRAAPLPGRAPLICRRQVHPRRAWPRLASAPATPFEAPQSARARCRRMTPAPPIVAQRRRRARARPSRPPEAGTGPLSSKRVITQGRLPGVTRTMEGHTQAPLYLPLRMRGWPGRGAARRRSAHLGRGGANTLPAVLAPAAERKPARSEK